MKVLPPVKIDDNTYKKLLKIISDISLSHNKKISIREALVFLIENYSE